MQGKHGRPIAYPSLLAIYGDFGLNQGVWVYWYLRTADQARLLTGAVGLLFACGLIIPKSFRRKSRPKQP